MAVNSEATMKKSKKATKTCPSAVFKAVPDNYEKVTFIQLNSEETYEDKAIIGKISKLNPIGNRVKGCIRKLLVTDGLEGQKEDQKKLPIFLLNRFAQDSEAAEVEGYIIIANFSVEKSTCRNDDEFPFQILVKKEESKVWFGKKVASSHSKKERNKKKNVKKNMNGNIQEPVILSNHYEYVPLRDLRETESKETYNIYGIVEKCDIKSTQSTGKCRLELVLTDNTESGFICSVYSAKDEIFPNIYPGDVVRIHRMQVYKFRSKLKGKCLSSKFMLVFSKNNECLKPRTIAKSFTFTNEDAVLAKNLFEWYDKKNQPKLISEIQRGDFVNIICQVIGVYIAKKTDAVILKIWDGTKSNEIESSHWGLRDEKLDEKLFSIAKCYYVVLSVYGQHCTVASELKPGQFIEICDAHLFSPKDNPDECKLCLHAGNKDKRGIRVLDLDDDRITELKKRLEKIIADAQEFANQTDDILSHDNTIFLNCDISSLPSSQMSQKNGEDNASISASHTNQRSARTEEENATIDALNTPMPSRDEEAAQEQNVISVVDAAVKPGQSTLEFGEEMQREYLQVDQTQGVELSVPVDRDYALNKTPVEFRMLLHNPSSQANINSLPPFTHDSPEEWWKNSLTAVSVTEGHSDIKPSSLAEVINHEVPYKFRTLCVVLSYKPNVSSVLELIHLYCPDCMFMSEDAQPQIEPFIEQDGLFYFYCPECSVEDRQNRPILKYTYLFSLELHDGTIPTGLEAFIWGDNAVRFFKDITPEQVLRDQELANSVLEMLWSICPNNRPLSSIKTLNNEYNKYPDLDCCIFSYTVSNQIVYQIFDTRLI